MWRRALRGHSGDLGYFSKPCGRALLRKVATPYFAVALLLGLAVLTLVLELPMVGGVLAVLVTLFGFGVFTSLVFAYFQQRRTF
jgi:hypothetical protein